ncbi:hypothetical protein NDU88_000728 [Pleurodeles waltl]|uniref:Uncharacterized protein n=1 Tax=Pleurodeles waltl TaxID=8319 RepID=A0AAV7SXI0_PLEWA|nr:hypothetical protein NDU88_000728 [Pleurodeles waltl]
MFPAKLRVITDERTHVFTSPEDAWTWMHAKGFAQPREAAGADENWSTTKPRKRSKRHTRGQPTEEQAAEERARALKETPLLTRNSFETLRSHPVEGSDSDSISSDSTYIERPGAHPQVRRRTLNKNH